MVVVTGAVTITEMVEVLGQIDISVVETDHILIEDVQHEALLCNENYDLREGFFMFHWRDTWNGD